jgi:DMSO/TMAO reductase YedYZ molybdopterin-dependent catalytic subunit
VPAATCEPRVAPHAELALEIISPDKTVVLSLEDVKKLPVTEGWAGIKNSAGNITPPEQTKGVSIAELCKLVGGLNPDQAVNIVAKDGYAMTMSYEQAVNGKVMTYNPTTGNEVKLTEPVQIVVAYERGGQPLPEESDGTFRLAGISSKNDQVIDGHWTVKWVRQIVIKSAEEEWMLHLQGALTEEMDRATFQSGASPNCHRRTWKDDQGHEWSGIPLWLLVGRIDDAKQHETRAFADRIADSDYPIDIVAADGYSVTLKSSRISLNDEIIVALEMDGQPLEDKYFPLRLVGVGLTNKEMIGQIAQIIAHMPPTPTPTAGPQLEPAGTPAPSTGVALTIMGKVAKETTFSLADLQAIQVQIKAEHPKKGSQDYTGARLNDLLSKAGVAAEAANVLMTSSDGYVSEVPLADVVKCADCMLAIGEDGKLTAVMPGMQSGFWSKDVVKIEVK